MKKQTVTIMTSAGMDGREVAMCVQTASRFNAEIHLTDGYKRMNAKSIMGMMALGLAYGDNVTIETDGKDEGEALAAMIGFFEGK